MARSGKRDKDRVTILPGSLREPLHEHLARVRVTRDGDLALGLGEVHLPDGLALERRRIPGRMLSVSAIPTKTTHTPTGTPAAFGLTRLGTGEKTRCVDDQNRALLRSWSPWRNYCRRQQ